MSKAIPVSGRFVSFSAFRVALAIRAQEESIAVACARVEREANVPATEALQAAEYAYSLPLMGIGEVAAA